MVIYLNDYRKANTAKVAARSPYKEELLCVNWNPAVSLIAMSCYRRPQELSPQLPHDGAALEADFMDRVYALASQI